MYQEGYEIYGPANMIYYPGRPLELGGDVINSATTTNLQLGKNQAALRSQRPGGGQLPQRPGGDLSVFDFCLHVLDGRKVELPGLIDNSLVAEAALYSRMDMIEPAAQPAQLPAFWAVGHARPGVSYYQRMDLRVGKTGTGRRLPAGRCRPSRRA